jgi:hypothetical protein
LLPRAALDSVHTPTRERLVLAAAIVLLTLFATWEFIDYRTQPPPPPVAAPL